MDPKKYEKIFNLMQQFGVEYFKNDELEIKMRESSKPVAMPTAIKQKPGPKRKLPDPQAIPPVDMKIEHHVNEVANLLRLSDNDLVDKLFPDYSQTQEGS